MNDNIEQIRHVLHHFRDENPEFTAIFELNEPVSLFLYECAIALINNDTVDINVGFAYCHPKDQFCKKTGRELAKSRIESYQFKVEYIHRYDDSVQIYLELNDEKARETNTTFVFKIYDNSRISIY